MARFITLAWLSAVFAAEIQRNAEYHVESMGVDFANIDAADDPVEPRQLSTNYQFYTPYEFKYHLIQKSTKATSISFRVKCYNDAHILLTDGEREFEVVLGGWANTKSVIRDGRNGPELASFMGKVCLPDYFRDFEIDWSSNKIKDSH